MNTYIESIPYGSIVAIAVNDAVQSSPLTAAQRSGLDSLGGGGSGCEYGIDFNYSEK